MLYEIYVAYFPWEIANSTIYSDLEKRSEKAYKEFVKEFDICPAILTKTMSFQIWNSVLNLNFEIYKEVSDNICSKKAKGKYLTFSKFIDLLIKVSYLYARDSQEMPNELEMPSEILIMLLEKFELSNGFLNLEKKTNKPHTSRTSLLPSREIVSLINSAKEGNTEEVIEYIKDKNMKMIQRINHKRAIQQKITVSHNVPQIMQVNPMNKQFEYSEDEQEQ